MRWPALTLSLLLCAQIAQARSPAHRRLVRALELFSHGRNRAATELLQKTLQEGPVLPDRVICHLYLGLIAAEGGNEEQAKSEFREALTLDSNAALPKRVPSRASELFLLTQRKMAALSLQRDVPPSRTSPVPPTLSPVPLVVLDESPPPKPRPEVEAAPAPPPEEADAEAETKPEPEPASVLTPFKAPAAPVQSASPSCSPPSPHALRTAAFVTGGAGAAAILASIGLYVAGSIAASNAGSARDIATSEEMSSRYAKLTYAGEWFLGLGAGAIALSSMGFFVDWLGAQTHPVPDRQCQ